MTTKNVLLRLDPVLAESMKAVADVEGRSVSDVARQFIDRRIGAVPVLDDDARLMGMVSYVDVLASTFKRGGSAASL